MKKLLALVLALCMAAGIAAAFAEETAPTYTYRTAAAEFPTNWSPFQNQTAIDSNLMDWLQSAFYEFDFNEDKDGYVLKPLVVEDFPTDVSADYAGEEWGIEEGETARAWKFVLRDGLMWEDGTPITAADFVTSAQLLLDPKAQNHRADGFYSGNLVVANSEAYLKQGLTEPTQFGKVKASAGLKDTAALIEAYKDEKGWINWANSFGDTYDFEAAAWTGSAEDAVVETPLTVGELYEFYTTGAGAAYATWATPEQLVEWTEDELFMNYQAFAGDFPFEKVGIKALNDKELVLILAKPLEGFYLYYGIPVWLVNEKLYTECASENEGVYTNSYGTSLETTMSWGPYKLGTFQSDKVYDLVRNENWFGYKLPENEGLYQTDVLNVSYVQEPATRMEMFLNGQLDVNGLNKDYIKEYASSDYTYYDEGDSVFAMVFNPDLEALKTAQAAAGEHINKTIITVKDFRIAMSLAMNRSEFVLAADPTSSPAFALYGGQIVADPEEGVFYRTTDVAKQVVVDFWGLKDEIGEGKLYATVDDAIDSITGYNLEMAREYFDKAYDEAISSGLMTEEDTILIMVGTPNATSAFYNAGYDFIVNNYTEAVKGTKLEGKLTFDRDSTLGNGFSDALRTNQVDMLFGVGWTGSTFDPFGLIEAYVTENYQYDPAWKPKNTKMTVTLDGEEYTTDVFTWYLSITNNKITAQNAAGEDVELDITANPETRIQVLGDLENVILQNYDFIPLMGDASAKLKGMKINYYVEDEVFPLSRGGIKYMTFNYDDAAWDTFVAEQGGTLNYK
ncbi:MAG: hypothetical protein IKE15_02185 [Clostridia bacterium]|nr:hypothetical protein [Clostridia bacterium]